MKKRIASIDFGRKRMGIALSDPEQKIALPHATAEGIREVIEILKKQELAAILIGLPLLMKGGKGEMALLVEAFAKEIEEALRTPVILVDERLSSKHAEALLRETHQSRKKRQKGVDQVAAATVLQTYLDQQNFLV